MQYSPCRAAGKHAVLCVGLNKAFLSLKKYKAEFAKFALAIFRRILRAAPGHLIVWLCEKAAPFSALPGGLAVYKAAFCVIGFRSACKKPRKTPYCTELFLPRISVLLDEKLLLSQIKSGKIPADAGNKQSAEIQNHIKQPYFARFCAFWLSFGLCFYASQNGRKRENSPILTETAQFSQFYVLRFFGLGRNFAWHRVKSAHFDGKRHKACVLLCAV